MEKDPLQIPQITSIPRLAEVATGLQSDISRQVSLIEPPQIASNLVFDRVYQQIAKGLRGKTNHEKGSRFVKSLEEGYKRNVRPIEEKGLLNTDLFQQIKDRIDSYVEQFKGDPTKYQRYKQQGDAIYSLFVNHVNKLVRDQQVDPLVAKTFLFTALSLFLFNNYNEIAKSNEEVSYDELRSKNEQFAVAANNIWNKYPKELKQEQEGAFYHFCPTADSHIPKSRIYISASLYGAPDKVLGAWYQALQETDMLYKVYFKIPTGLSMRSETIVVYLNDSLSIEELQKLFTAFKKHCPSELLSENSMVTARPICNGISIASEPHSINKLRKYSDIKKTSYNIIIAHCMQLAFELSLRDAKNSNETNITPKKLKPGAQKYFAQLVRLIGINPETMFANTDKISPKVAEILERI